MLDLHTHILPGVDDGSKSPQESMTMLEAETGQGIDRVIFTPHFYAEEESPQSFLHRRDRALQQLMHTPCGNAPLPRFMVGAEVSYFGGMSRVEELDQLCIGNTRTMLVEMPFAPWSRTVMDEMTALRQQRDIRPIIAHVERYLGFQSRETIDQLYELGAWIQVNANFFLRWQTSGRAMRMLRNREIHFIGSDCHNMTSRPPNMNAALCAISKKLGPEALEHLERMAHRLLKEV